MLIGNHASVNRSLRLARPFINITITHASTRKFTLNMTKFLQIHKINPIRYIQVRRKFKTVKTTSLLGLGEEYSDFLVSDTDRSQCSSDATQMSCLESLQ